MREVERLLAYRRQLYQAMRVGGVAACWVQVQGQVGGTCHMARGSQT